MDLHTLHVEHAALLTLLMILTVINIRIHRTAAGVVWFAGFGSCICAGAILIAVRTYIPESISFTFGNVMFSVGYLCLHRSMTAFFGKGAKLWGIQAGLVALQIVSQIVYGQFHPDTTKRLLALSIILALQVGLTAVFVARHTPAFMKAAGWLMGTLLALLSLGNFGRLVSLVILPAPNDYLRGGGMLAWTVLNTTVLQVGVLVAFVWMTAARLHHDLEVQALTDPLTGVLNRRAIEILAKRTFAASLRGPRPISAILFDLDDFKKINDSFGHLCGDNMLIAISRCVEQNLRPGDMMARLGGDEFVILLEATDIETANSIARRLRSAIEQLRIQYDRHEVSATASFGVGQVNDNSDGWNELLLSCDRALYEEKGTSDILAIKID
ncbi:MAG: GGDEF domain-containing protein [Terracidiphilus sp.]